MPVDWNQEQGPKGEEHAEEQYAFLQETFKDEQVKTKKIVGSIVKIFGKGLIFGLASCLAFYALKPVVSGAFLGQREEITIPDDEELVDGEVTQEVVATPELTVENYREMSEALKEVADIARESVVSVEAVLEKDRIENAEVVPTSVAGVIVWKNAAEITIVAPSRALEETGQVEVTFCDGRTYEASLEKQDSNAKIAVLKVRTNVLKEGTKESIQAATLGNSNTMSKGVSVIALGNPFGYAGGTGFGIISSTESKVSVADRQYRLLMTDITAAEDGSSILFNIDGEVVGIGDQVMNGVGNKNLVSVYAISGMKADIERLANGDGVPYLGIHGIEVTEEISNAQGIPQGIYVKEVEVDSPAMQSGIQCGDVIVSIKDHDAHTMYDYSKQLSKCDCEQQITLKVMREGNEGYEEVSFDVTVGSKE